MTARVDTVFRTFDRVDSPGCAGGVYRDGRILYARGYGMANLELGVPNTPRTVFDIGSISKEFAATAVLLLAHEGKASLGDDVRKYFPELPAYASGATELMLRVLQVGPTLLSASSHGRAGPQPSRPSGGAP